MTNYSLLDICLREIEGRINLKKTNPLSNSDCDYISFVIKEKTKVVFGRSTIRRLWDNNYKRFPQDSTLDALAQFLDYENWNSFKKHSTEELSGKRKKTFWIWPKKKQILVVAALTIVPLIFIFTGSTKNQNSNIANTESVKFTCKQTENLGLPKSVIFEYNIDSCTADSFFIQQNWRKETKEQVYKNNYHHTDIYYRPGIHMAKLIANSTIIKQIPVVINSDDWMGIIIRGPKQKDFTALTLDQIERNGYMTTANDTFTYDYVKGNGLFPLVFTNVSDFGEVDLNNCLIETRVKAEHSNPVCNEILFRYSSKNLNAAHISLTPIGCISKLCCKFSDSFISGKTNDLSKFGCDVTQWSEISIRIENKNVTVYINQELVLETVYTKSMDSLQQISYGFSGAGSVDYITIKSLNGDILYQDDFNDVLL